MKKDKIIDTIINIVIIAIIIAGFIGFGYFNYWIFSNPDIPDWFKYGYLFGRK